MQNTKFDLDFMNSAVGKLQIILKLLEIPDIHLEQEVWKKTDVESQARMWRLTIKDQDENILPDAKTKIKDKE
jgi:hypothetical protein